MLIERILTIESVNSAHDGCADGIFRVRKSPVAGQSKLTLTDESLATHTRPIGVGSEEAGCDASEMTEGVSAG